MTRKAFFISAITVLLSALSAIHVHAEAIGTWKVYHSYSYIEEIVPAGSKVYVKAYGNIYSYSTADGTVKTYTKEDDGLGAQNAKFMAWVEVTKKLVVVYEDYTIDLLSQKSDVETIVSLREKRMTTDKTVNSIYVDGQFAYLCTAFGIIKLNTKDASIAETYSIGMNIDSMSIANNTIYIKTTDGLLYETETSSNLLDKNVWKESETAWDDVSTAPAEVYNEYGIIVSDKKNNCYWGSDAEGRLTKYLKEGDDFIAASSGVIPDGPKYPEHTVVKIFNGKVHTLRGLYNMGALGDYVGYVQTFDGYDWKLFDNSFADNSGLTHNDYMSIDIDPLNKGRIMVGSASALIEYTDGVMTNRFSGSNAKTATGTSALVYSVTSTIMSLAYDNSGNLWIFNRYNPALTCYTKNGEWKTFTPAALEAKGKISRYVSAFFDSRGLLWFCHNHFSPNFFGFYNPQTDEARIIDEIINTDGKNINPPSTYDSRVVTEDKEGNIWLGTNYYLVYLTPADIKEMMSSEDMSSIRVTQHKVARNDGTGLADYLLSGVGIMDIKVDNANRKWVATDNNGVYLISSDNNTELEHFTTENSPLPTNNVYSIGIDDKSGKVYFGTLKGLCSYESGVTNSYGEIAADNVYAYPNPVPPEYTGEITIKGLVENAQIKITTSSGYVVHEGVSNGPVYKWNGMDNDGNRVASGVYMVLVTTATGENGCVTKIAMLK